MFSKQRVEGLRAVATAMSPLSMTSCTRCLAKPVLVPVMRKTRGIVVVGRIYTEEKDLRTSFAIGAL